MQLREMIDKYPQQYIAVAYTKKGIDSLIETATVLKVYPTLLDAYDNLSEIKAYKKRYSDFDIVYGDYEDYAASTWFTYRPTRLRRTATTTGSIRRRKSTNCSQ